MADEKSNTGMLRGSGLRAQRSSVDTGTGSKRVGAGTGQRAEHLSRGQFVNYYEDLGFSATPEGAKQIRADEAKFQSNIKESQSDINAAQKEVDAANARLDAEAAKLPGFDDALATGWKEAQGGFVTIFVGTPGNIEGKYKLPKESVPNLVGSGFEVVNLGTGKWGVSPTIQGRTVGAELHQTLQNSRDSVYNQYVKEATPVIKRTLAENSSALQGFRDEVAGHQGQVDAAQSVLKGNVAAREQMWADEQGKYQGKLDTMNTIFKSLTVDKGGPGYEGGGE